VYHWNFFELFYLIIFTYKTDLPEKIIDLVALTIHPDKVTLKWMFQMNGSSPRIGSEVEVRKGSILETTLSVGANEQNFTVLYLYPLSFYQITFFSVTSVGRSQPSSINITTISLSKY